MAFQVSSKIIGNQPVANNSTVQNHPLGLIVQAEDPTYGGGEFIYLKGVASTAVGSVVKYNPDDFSTSLATANDEGSLAVAMSASVVSEFGWYQIKGKASGKALTGFADNADCYLTATVGSIDDAVVAGDKIYGMRGASAVASGLADLEIDHPYALNGKALDGTEITATGTETNVLAGVTGGTVLASKAVVVDANKDIGSFRHVTMDDAGNIVLQTTTGTKIGTATGQKLGFFNATPVVQQTATASLETVLSNLGLRAVGAAAPLASGSITLSDAANIVVQTTTGTQIATATGQKIGFYGTTPTIQIASGDQAAVGTTAATTTSPWGYGSSTQADGIITLLNKIRADLVTLGLIKGAA